MTPEEEAYHDAFYAMPDEAENERIMREYWQGFFDPAGRRNMNDVCLQATFRERRKKRCEASEIRGAEY